MSVYVEDLRRWVSTEEAVAYARSTAPVAPSAPSPLARRLAELANAACTTPKRIAGTAYFLEQLGIDPQSVSQEVVQEATTLYRRMEPKLEPDARLFRKLKGERDERTLDKGEEIPEQAPVRKQTRAKVFGYSITAVLRWMGANGWKFEDAAVVCATCGAASIADVTIRLQLKAGKDGLRGPAAPVTPSQAKQLRAWSK